MSNGQLYIVSAPSGAGKTSLVKRLVAEVDHLAVSVSHTTRIMRPGEQHGTDYYFVSVSEFESLIAKDQLIECAKVFDNYYGTSKATVEQQLTAGNDVILEIDWQGAQQIRQIKPESLSVFILPPSTEVLQQRLQNRGQDNAEVIARRMREAVTEISHYDEFDYIIVNDEFERALSELKNIMIANRLTKNRRLDDLKELLNSLIKQA